MVRVDRLENAAQHAVFTTLRVPEDIGWAK
jgi:hypothetical protein